MAPADVEGVLGLWELLMAEGEAADPRYRRSAIARSVLTPYARDVWARTRPFPATWVAEDDGLVGFVGILPQPVLHVLDQPLAARITDVYVLPRARRKGVARDLVAAATRAALAAGFTATEVGTLAADSAAISFWTAIGFGPWQVVLSRRMDA